VKQIAAETLNPERACRAADGACFAGRKRRGRYDPQIQGVIFRADDVAFDQTKSALKLGELGNMFEILRPRADSQSQDLVRCQATDRVPNAVRPRTEPIEPRPRRRGPHSVVAASSLKAARNGPDRLERA